MDNAATEGAKEVRKSAQPSPKIDKRLKKDAKYVQQS
jgi:hypothetical protein